MKDIKLDGLSREEWLKVRKTGIGGSDVAGVMRESPFATPLDVYLDKTWQSEPIEDNDRMRAGRFLEPAVAEMFKDMFPEFDVAKDTHMRFKHDAPFMYANTDYLLKDENGDFGVLEIKTTSSWYSKTWSDDVPTQYYLQLQYYIGIMDFKFGYIAVLIDGYDFRVYRFERDDEIIKRIFSEVTAFWRDNVLAGKEPEPMNDDDLKKLFPHEVEGERVEADALDIMNCKEYLNALDNEVMWKDRKAELAFEIKKTIGDAEILVDGENILAKLKTNARGSRVLTVPRQFNN